MTETQAQQNLTPDQLEELRRLVEAERERRRVERARQLPGWLPAAMATLPYVLISVTLLNLFIVSLAIGTPWLGMWFGPAVTDPIYAAYSLICPQRPSHTFFIGGHPMAFEQRDVSIHAGFAAAGLLYLVWPLLRRPLATWLAVLMVLPMLIDVAISTAGWLPSTWISRLWTGGLAGIAVIWWSYPRFDAYLRKVQAHVARLRAARRE